MFIGKRVNALAKNVFAAALSATLVLGLVPGAAFATTAENAGGGFSVENAEADTASNVVEGAEGAGIAESEENQSESNSEANGASEGIASGEADVAMPAESVAGFDVINESVPLEVVAQAESTRSYFLAQTLESTRTVPVVSAKLPIDTGVTEEPVAPVKGDGPGEEATEGGEDSDESDPAGSLIAADSTVVGSFVTLGMAFAVEPGGETVALCAVDPQVAASDRGICIVPTAVVDANGTSYEVARIADGVFTMNSDTITTVYVPASVTDIASDAFVGNTTLERIWVSPDNSTYASFDGCLYTADHMSLLLIPGGRQEGVRIHPKTESIEQNAVSHCASITELTVDADSPLLASEDVLYNAAGDAVEIVAAEDEATNDVEDAAPTVLEKIVLGQGESTGLSLTVLGQDETTLVSPNLVRIENDGIMEAVTAGASEILVVNSDDTTKLRTILPIEILCRQDEQQTSASNDIDYQKPVDLMGVYEEETVQYAASGETAAAYAFTMHDISWYQAGGQATLADAMNVNMTTPHSVTKNNALWNTIYGVIFNNGRIVIVGTGHTYWPFGLTQSGGVGGVQYSYSSDADAVRYDVPCGPSGISPTQNFYVWVYGEDKYAKQGFMGNAFDGYGNVGGSDYDTALAKNLGTNEVHIAANGQIWNNFDTVIFYNNRLLVRSTSTGAKGLYFPFGLTASGGIGSVQYSYSKTGERLNVPYGPYGFKPVDNIYVWIFSDANPTGLAFVMTDYDGFGDCGAMTYDQALTKDMSAFPLKKTKGQQIWNNIWRVIFVNSRIIVEGSGHLYYPFGLTATGGITRVKYSYSDSPDAIKHDVPNGPEGFCPTQKFYVWIFGAGVPSSYALTWNANGGSWSDTTTTKTSQVDAPASAMTGPSAGIPGRAGLVFIGWSETQTATSGLLKVTPVKSTTYYAIWSGYKITLNKGSGTGGDAGPLYYKGGTNGLFSNSICTTAKTTVAVPSLKGYRFDGYFTAASGGDQLVTATGAVQNVGTSRWSADGTLYAHWTEIAYPIVFDAGAGAFDPSWVAPSDPVEYRTGSIVAPSSSDISRRGYTLAGWSTSTNPANADTVATGKLTITQGGTTTVEALYADTSPVPSPITLYPVWRVDTYGIALDRDGGSYEAATLSALTSALASDPSHKAKFEGDEITYTVLTPAFSLPLAEKTGWTFEGWSRDGGATKSPTVSFNPADASFVLENLSYEAIWSQNDYRIAYYEDDAKTAPASWPDGASPVMSFGVDGPATMVLQKPVRVGYSFTGWSGPGIAGDANPAGTTVDLASLITASLPKAPAIALAYVAHWAQDDYEVRYVLTGEDDNYVGSFAPTYTGLNGTAPSKQQDGVYLDSYRYDETGQAEPLVLPNKTEGAFDLTRPGYVFAGWVRTDDGTNAPVESIDPTVQTGDLVFEARWTPVASVTLPAATTPQSVGFMLDRATGSVKEVVEGASPQALTVSSTTPVDCELSVMSEKGAFDVAELFEAREGTDPSEIDDLVSSIGFVFASDGSGLSDTATTSLSFLHDTQGTQVGTLKVQGSEQFALPGSTSLCAVDVTGALRLAQRMGSAFDDIAVDVSRISIKSAEDLPAGPLNFANIIWTVKLPQA